MSSHTPKYQDAPGLETEGEELRAVQQHHGAIASASSSSSGAPDILDVEAAAGDVRGVSETQEQAGSEGPSSSHTLQENESYGRVLSRVLTGEDHGTARSDASQTSTDGGLPHRRSGKGFLHLSRRRRKPKLGAGTGSKKDGSSLSTSKLSIRKRAEELASKADSEKVAEADRIKLTGADGKPTRRHGVKDRVLHFTPSWFSVTMGTGVIATLLNLLPWPSIHSGLRYPATVFLLGDIVIFVLFVCAFLARYIMYPEVVPLTFKHPQKSMFLGTLPMGLITIISGIAQLGTNEFHLGIGFALAASGLWWLATVISLMTAIGVPFSMMTYQKHYFEGITAALLLPIVPPITAAATGSVLAEILMYRYPTYAFTIMVVSYLVLGIGLPLALLILVLYFQRLLLFKSPPRDVIISVFLPLGPCGQGGEACLHLGRVALHLFPRISRPIANSGVPQLYSVGEALYGAGLISALLLFGLGVWWLFIGIFTIFRELRRGKLGFNMGWWGLTFPFASLAICCARLAIELDSLTLKIVYTGFVIANLLLWSYVAIPTAKGAWNGQLFNAPCLADLPLKP